MAADQSALSRGTNDLAFDRVRDLFDTYLEADPAFSAQLCIYVGGRPAIDLVGGPRLELDSLTGVYSATKGVAALTVATVIDAGKLDLDGQVRDYWPEFAAAGKATVTVRQLLSHQAGLAAVRGRFELDEVLTGSSRGAARLAAQAPLWRPGTAFGYHALTIGLLMEELVLRATGRRLQEVFESDVRTPRAVDFYIGLPEREDARYVPVTDVVLTPGQAAEIAARPPADALQETVFTNVLGPDDRSEQGFSTNNPRVRRAGPSAIGGVGSARGLARLYADALPTSASPIADPAVLEAMAQQHSWGMDRTLDVMNCFGVVFMLPQPRMPFGSLGAFGHDGAGGALAFADPVTDVAFGYIPVPMQYPGGADSRALALARLARDVVAAGR